MNGIIYAIKYEGSVIYVGQTTWKIYKRFAAHKTSARKSPHCRTGSQKLSAHMSANNLVGYTCEEIESGIPKEKLDERERYWISFYNTMNNGCNTTVGGKSLRGKDHPSYGVTPSKESCLLRSAALKGRKKTEEHKKKIGNSLRGKQIPKIWKPVTCLENGVTYPSIRIAAKDLGLDEKRISEVLNGRMKHVRGFHFERHQGDDTCQQMLRGTASVIVYQTPES